MFPLSFILNPLSARLILAGSMLALSLFVGSIDRAAAQTNLADSTNVMPLLEEMSARDERNLHLFAQEHARQLDQATGVEKTRLLIEALVWDVERDAYDRLRVHLDVLEEINGQNQRSSIGLIWAAFDLYWALQTENADTRDVSDYSNIVADAETGGHAVATGMALALQGLSLGLQGHFYEALNTMNLLAAVAPLEDMEPLIALLAAWTQAYIYTELLNLDQAAAEYRRAISIADAANYPVDISNATYNIGSILMELGMVEIADSYFSYFENFALKYGTEGTFADANFNLAIINNYRGNYTKSHELAKALFQYYPEDSWINISLHKLEALNLAVLGQPKDARQHLDIVDAYFARNPDIKLPEWVQMAEMARAVLDFQNGNYQAALEKIVTSNAAISAQLRMTSTDQLMRAVRSNIESTVRQEFEAAETANAMRIQQQRFYMLLALAIILGAGVSLQIRTSARLKESRDHAEQASRHKSEFLANISHEIRTPLNGISGALSLLRRTVKQEASKELLGVAESSFNTVTTIVSDLLDISQIESGQVTIELEPTDVENLIRSSAAIFRESAERKGLSLTVEVGALTHNHYLLDATRVRQVLANIVSNAIKYTEKGAISIRAGITLTAGTMPILEITVEDTGLGVPPELQDSVLNRFERVHDRSHRHIDGIGLGLSIVKMLLDAMDGELRIESDGDSGSTFRIAIPTNPASSAICSTKGSLADSARSPARKILLAEDVELNQVLIAKMLQHDGHVVDCADNGALALEALERAVRDQAPYDLVFMDLQMPVMTGIEATLAIRDLRSHGAATPIVALTANAYDETRKECLDAGMNGFVSKPLTLEDLREAIESAVPTK